MSEEIPESFIRAMSDIIKGKTVPLDKALNEAPPSKELKKIFRDLDKLEAEKNTWKEMYEMQTRLVLSLELNKIEKEKEIEKLKENQRLELYQKELKEQIKGLKSCIEKCWNCFGDSAFKIWDFAGGLELLVEKVQDAVETKRIYQKIVDQTYDILAENKPADLPEKIFSIPECVENMSEELKDLIIENKRLEDKVERYRQKYDTQNLYNSH